MNIIEPSAQLYTEAHPYKKIEKIGRTCYKSEDKITDTSCYKFVSNMMEHKHYAMLEHAWFHFRLSNLQPSLYNFLNVPALVLTSDPNNENDYIITVSMSHLVNPRWTKLRDLFRELLNIVDSLYDGDVVVPDYSAKNITRQHSNYGSIRCGIQYIDDSILYDALNHDDNLYMMHKHMTFKFVCDRGITHELVRHRMSFAQESQRYCNYGKDKFGASINVCKPSLLNETTPEYLAWRTAIESAEDGYLEMTQELGVAPQIARSVLPNATKADIWVTGSMDQWEHFFDMRSREKTGKAHPDMKVIADMAYELYIGSEAYRTMMYDTYL